MSSQFQNEVWQVVVQGELYEADTFTLKHWIAEGRILPTDRVKKGNLSWNEAQRVPTLKPVFMGEENPKNAEPPAPPPPAVPQAPPMKESFNMAGVQDSFGMGNVSTFQPVYNPGMSMPAVGAVVCYYHPQLAPEFICRVCGATFCKECPKFVGSAPICKLCGDLCTPYAAVKEVSMRWMDQHSGFGFNEFSRALRYPLKDMVVLLIAATVYSFFVIAGKYAYGIAGPLASVMGYTLMFGCMSLTINRVCSGKLDGSFMPDFSEFSFKEMVVGPTLLGIGIMLVTAGPGIVLVLAVGYGLLHGISPSDLSPINLLQVGGALLIVAIVGLLWGIFYYPMALIVAGFTQDFKSVINPLVGLDAIKNMGMVYPKAFFMCLGVWIMGFIASLAMGFMGKITPFPILAVIVSGVAEGMITFYINLVVACILGLSLFKCADQLGIYTD